MNVWLFGHTYSAFDCDDGYITQTISFVNCAAVSLTHTSTTVPMDDKVDADDTLTLHIPKRVKQLFYGKTVAELLLTFK